MTNKSWPECQVTTEKMWTLEVYVSTLKQQNTLVIFHFEMQLTWKHS